MSASSNLYLAYDPTGKSSRVFLTGTPPDGADWLLGVGDNAEEGRYGTIRAASGPLRGWFLTVAGTEGDPSPALGSSRRPMLVLSRDSAQRIEASRIWEHK